MQINTTTLIPFRERGLGPVTDKSLVCDWQRTVPSWYLGTPNREKWTRERSDVTTAIFSVWYTQSNRNLTPLQPVWAEMFAFWFSWFFLCVKREETKEKTQVYQLIPSFGLKHMKYGDSVLFVTTCWSALQDAQCAQCEASFSRYSQDVFALSHIPVKLIF